MEDMLHHARFCVDRMGKVDLKDFPTDLGDDLKKKDLKEHLEKDREHIDHMQEALYAEDRHSLLLIFQAMDAAGKDSCIRHVMSGVNPQGCQVWSFKQPSAEELEHDMLWRHAKATPERGRIGIHNRSHYEEVLVVKVHPGYLLAQQLPGIRSVDDVDEAFWEARYASIRSFEEHLHRQGTVIMKFYLHMSRAKQKERFLERIDDPRKNWKFSASDVKERAHWDAYMQAYESAIGATAAPHAPWYIVPADDQWESRAIVGRLIRERMEALRMKEPEAGPSEKEAMTEARKALLAEG